MRPVCPLLQADRTSHKNRPATGSIRGTIRLSTRFPLWTWIGALIPAPRTQGQWCGRVRPVYSFHSYRPTVPVIRKNALLPVTSREGGRKWRGFFASSAGP